MKKCPECGMSIEDDVFQCGYCQSEIAKREDDSGVKRVYSGSYVYVLTNSAMPGLVKIGYTDIDPYKRASQLSNTNVPAPFKVYDYVEVDDPQEVEKAVHKELAKYRKHRKREFFKIRPEKAVEVLVKVSGQSELRRQQKAARTAKREREKAIRIELKRQQEAARVAKWEREKAARKKQKQLEQQVFEEFDAVIEKLKKGTNIKLYKKLEKYSRNLAKIFFIIGIISLIYLETETTIIICITLAVVGLIHLILSKIAKERLESLKTNVCNEMDARFGQSWHPYIKTCILLIYNKLNLNEW